MTNTQHITVNEREIMIATHGNEKFVAIKPICEAIGVDYDYQLEKIKNDEILSQLTKIYRVVAADGKERKMRVLPLRYIFGWLFTINPNNVKPEVKQDVINYKMECYNALFDSFTKRNSILKEKTKYQVEVWELEEELKQDERYKKIQTLKQNIKNASQRLNALDKNVVNEQLNLFEKS